MDALDRARRSSARLPRDAAALYRLRAELERDAVRRAQALDRALQHQLSPGHRRHLAAFRPAQQLHHHPRGDRRLDGDRDAHRAVLRRVPDHVRAAERRVLRPRRGALLRLFRGHADPDVHHHRHLGRAEPRVRGAQVLPLHALRLALDADRDALSLQRGGRQLRDPRLAQGAAHARRADRLVFWFSVRLRGQGADVAGAHLAPRRAYRGAHRRLGGARRDPAQARRLRLRALLAADPAGCLALPRLHDGGALADRHCLHRLRHAGADRSQAAHRLLLDLAHGVRHARFFPLQRARRRRRPRADDLARLRLGGHVPVRGRALRSHAHAHDRGLWRRGEHHAQVRDAHDALRHGERRPAGDERLRRRVHGDHGRDEGELLDRAHRRDHRHPGRGLYAVDVQARHLRRRGE